VIVPAKIPAILAIAGSDPSGGAGAQADIKTFSAFSCYGMAALTAITVQNTQGVRAVQPLASKIVAGQIDAIFADIETDAVKIGMLATPGIAEAVASALTRAKARDIVLDPVLAATRGAALSDTGLAEMIVARLLPLAALVTPNLAEAAALTQSPLARGVDAMAEQAKALAAFGARAVLVKGGHLEGAPVDVLFDRGGVHLFEGKRVATRNTHGAGCALSSAIAARLAHGAPLIEAIRDAKDWLENALAASADWRIGQGAGPPHHFHEPWRVERRRSAGAQRLADLGEP
jgi:hydroxymethylpyrimidine/phosphomethylpyrimidine kinase